MKRLLLLSSLLSLPLLAGAARAEPATADAKTTGATKAGTTSTSSGPTRIDFDDRLVQGQTNQAGSIYLFDRKPLPFEGMVEGRKEFRSQLREQVYGK